MNFKVKQKVIIIKDILYKEIQYLGKIGKIADISAHGYPIEVYFNNISHLSFRTDEILPYNKITKLLYKI